MKMAREGDGKRKSKRRVVKWAIFLVIALLIVVLLGRALRIAMESADRSSCRNNLKQIGLALHLYATDHDESFPTGETAAEVFGKLIEGGYLKEATGSTYDKYPVYVCPSARADLKAWKRTRKLTDETCSYDFVAGLSAKSPSDFLVMFDRSAEHHWPRVAGIPLLAGGKGRFVLFVDGHVSWSTEEGFQERMAWQREMGKTIEEGGEYLGFEEGRNRVRCKNHLEDIARALHTYASKHDGEFPPGETAAEMFGELIEEGLLSDKSSYPLQIPVYVCPSAMGGVWRWVRNGRVPTYMCGYEWVSGLNTESPPDFALVFDKAANHGKGRNVLHADGLVSWSTEEGFQERMEWQREMRRRMEERGEYVPFGDWREAQSEE